MLWGKILEIKQTLVQSAILHGADTQTLVRRQANKTLGIYEDFWRRKQENQERR